MQHLWRCSRVASRPARSFAPRDVWILETARCFVVRNYACSRLVRFAESGHARAILFRFRARASTGASSCTGRWLSDSRSKKSRIAHLDCTPSVLVWLRHSLTSPPDRSPQATGLPRRPPSCPSQILLTRTPATGANTQQKTTVTIKAERRDLICCRHVRDVLHCH